MRKFVMVSPSFWIGQTGRDLRRAGTDAQLLALYLLSNPLANYTGLYRLPIIYIANDLGLKLDQVGSTLAAIEQTGFARYDVDSEYVWIVEGARHQLGEDLKANDNKVKFVNKEFAAISKSCPFLRDYFDKYATSLHLKPRKDMPEIAAPAALVPAPEPVQTPKPEPIAVKALQPEAAPVAAEAELWKPRDIADSLARFLAERERHGLAQAGENAVATFVLNFESQHGAYLAERLMDAAAAVGDYDIIDHALYAEEVVARYGI